jgi:hypothetical protein
MWEELKNSDIDRVKSLWSDDNVFESVGMDEFIDDVNEVYRKKEGWHFLGKWYLSDFVNIQEIDGEYIERDLDIEA